MKRATSSKMWAKKKKKRKKEKIDDCNYSMISFAVVPDKLLARFDGCLRSDNRWWNRAAESPAPLALCS